MNTARRFIKTSAIYFAGNVLTKIISFFLLPLYTNHIAATDMGYYDLSVSYLNIFIPVICMDIWSGIMRFMFDHTDEKNKYKVITNGLLIFTGSLTIFTFIFLILSAVSDIKFLILIFVYGLLTMIQTLYTYVVRGLGYNTLFALSGIIGGLVNSVSNIILIICFKLSLESLYLSMIIGLALQIIIMEIKIKLIKNLSFKMLDKNLLKSLMSFSLPLSLNSACFWFLASYNHVGVSNILGLTANGIYSIAAKFTVVLGLVSNCFTMAWQELVYSQGNEKANKADFYTTASDYYIKFLMLAVLMLLPAINVIFPYFIGKEYWDAYPLLPLYLLATVASIYSFFLGNIFSAEKKTNIVFYSTIAAAATNVGLFHLLVGYLGIQAANVALLFGFTVNILIRIVILKRSFEIKLNYILLAFLGLLFAAGWYIYSTADTVINIIFAFVLVAVFTYIFRDLIKTGIKFIRDKRLNRKA